MKHLLVILLFPLIISAQADLSITENSKWLTDYDTAVSKAKKQDKNILLYFTGSDWCPPCKMLKQDLFETDGFKTLSKNYILLYVDIPRNKDILSKKQLEHNKELLGKYNARKVFPLLKVLNAKGKELDELSGYSMNGVVDSHLNLLERNK
ncbi:thioredoxin family protein [Maribacter sp. MAR_2009_72]|uniref:thioredoxin family protein n=1 Tax=Maribacter sp. MAR_2009_72 TaxID=1250050 RepID=UPI001199FAC7|nr:thioredoxin family protein [Maribacter sp. MAR_2009_72]TVZ13914.1 thioredoxin-related protein [Maribacter sp. MAR_2009_72]